MFFVFLVNVLTLLRTNSYGCDFMFLVISRWFTQTSTTHKQEINLTQKTPKKHNHLIHNINIMMTMHTYKTKISDTQKNAQNDQHDCHIWPMTCTVYYRLSAVPLCFDSCRKFLRCFLCCLCGSCVIKAMCITKNVLYLLTVILVHY